MGLSQKENLKINVKNYIFAIENAELPTHFTPMDYVTTGRHFIPQ